MPRWLTLHGPTPLATPRKAPAGASKNPGTYQELMPGRVEKLSWVNPRTLWPARNGVLASWFGDPTGRTRSRWAEQRTAAGAPADKVIRRNDPDRFSFMVIGDTGEGDAPQYAVVPGFLTVSQDTAFTVLASDVIYPVGATDDYGTKFFRPYQDYPAPIYAIPGNHDWYEDLNGFMRVFCDAPPLPAEPAPRPLTPAWLRSLLWHRPSAVDEQRLAEAGKLRSAPAQQAVQPGPYWAIDAGPVRIIGIDTGLLGTLDAEQGRWLREVSAGTGPEDPHHRLAPVRGRRAPPLPDRGRRHGRRPGPRSGAELRGRDRRRHPQLPALSGARARPRQPDRPVHRLGRRRCVHARHPHHQARLGRRRHRGRLPLLPAARRLARLLQQDLRPTAAPAPLLHPHRGRGDAP